MTFRRTGMQDLNHSRQTCACHAELRQLAAEIELRHQRQFPVELVPGAGITALGA